ncbi:GGDEF domain-containing protein [Methylobacterium dankookense]|uniref:diguanylate cyclase n=1 Tax=Methylobacterium dankookense TaxID=560405 RepID=A0A564FTZ3_9HYPH|nr:GGDEF domain-containing protein [Methylobacterium dankookense]GJD58200.1 hypothetical protein IFDJLNFL_4116 [Methylobacterium dankookense]VUF11268.1 putative diguanylate cyclase YdaM [Methylobacterium dankookense]
MDVLPDLQTLRLCSLLASTAFGLVFLAFWQGRRAEPFWLYWAGSSLLYAALMLGFARVEHVALIALFYALLAGTNILILAGVRAFDGRPAFRAWMLLPILATGLGCGLPAWLVPDPALAGTVSRIGGTALLASSSALAGATLAFGPQVQPSRGRRIAGLAILGYQPSYILAIVAEAAGWSEPNMAALLPMLSDQVLLGIMSLGLLAMPGERAQGALREAALRDALTGAWNRAGLAARCGLPAPGAAVILIDVDHFKAINDRRGHAAGDAVLVTLVARIAALLPGPADIVARLGGDEFAVVLHGTTLAAARGLAGEIRLAARRAGEAPAWTVSLGVAPAEGADLAGALARADAALYAAKAAGRDRAA